MTILAIDPGGACGWAVGTGSGRPLYGTWNIVPRRGESPGMRYVRMRAALHVVHEAYPDIRLAVYEQAHHRGGAATEYAGGYVATIQAWCAEHKIEHAAVHSATLKRFATGKGNATKTGMIIAAQLLLTDAGFSVHDIGRLTSDEADALHLLQYARQEIVPQ